MKYPVLSAALLALALLVQCHKSDPDPTPASQLPAATQTGANTFGCLVNGQAFTPKGNNGTSNLVLLYSPNSNGASINILTYRIDGKREQSINLFCGPVTQAKTFSLDIPATEGAASYGDDSLPQACNYYTGGNAPVYRKGKLTLSRIDPSAGVAAGTFEFTTTKPGCDTIKVTQGRFDIKF